MDMDRFIKGAFHIVFVATMLLVIVQVIWISRLPPLPPPVQRTIQIADRVVIIRGQIERGMFFVRGTDGIVYVADAAIGVVTTPATTVCATIDGPKAATLSYLDAYPHIIAARPGACSESDDTAEPTRAGTR